MERRGAVPGSSAGNRLLTTAVPVDHFEARPGELEGAWSAARSPAGRRTAAVVGAEDDHKRAWTADVPLDADRHAVLDERRLRRLVGTRAGTVFAVVDHYEPTETIRAPAPYRLTVNGVLQPGGS
ncbi:hypothetical protein [Streptomyces vietnamensis]|uniref:hypothetical protein n=1 Tax=Streptomyces vietnamensis TaxID=362257 RepID=UPI00131B288D|nr:hypothetical protein [Streptomyces vietnamensis]